MTNRGFISKSEGLLFSVASVINEDGFPDGGLGERYLKKLAENKDALHQVLYTSTQSQVNDTCKI